MNNELPFPRNEHPDSIRHRFKFTERLHPLFTDVPDTTIAIDFFFANTTGSPEDWNRHRADVARDLIGGETLSFVAHESTAKATNRIRSFKGFLHDEPGLVLEQEIIQGALSFFVARLEVENFLDFQRPCSGFFTINEEMLDISFFTLKPRPHVGSTDVWLNRPVVFERVLREKGEILIGWRGGQDDDEDEGGHVLLFHKDNQRLARLCTNLEEAPDWYDFDYLRPTVPRKWWHLEDCGLR